MSKLTVECIDWRPLERGTLRGFASVYIPALRMEIRDLAIHAKNGQQWAQLPGKAQVDRNKELIKDERGKIQYTPVVKLRGRDVQDAFSEAVIRAIQDYQFSGAGA